MRGPAWIVLPTYCEADNVERMVRGLRGAAPPDARVLIVDDASPDGTGRLADRLAAADPHVAVLHREEKGGLGPAYVAGFERALAGGAGALVQIDCDLSHDPATVPRLLAAIAAGADLAIGSRYVGGAPPRRRVEESRPACRCTERDAHGSTRPRPRLAGHARDAAALARPAGDRAAPLGGGQPRDRRGAGHGDVARRHGEHARPDGLGAERSQHLGRGP